MTRLDLLDDDDDMTIRIEKERYMYVSRSVGRCVYESVLVRWMYRHTVIGARKSYPLNDIGNDGTLMTMPVGAQFGSSLDVRCANVRKR
jgi:hypothetical protein